MGEIKSTLELALEKTGKLSISEKEKEEMKQKEIAQKATGLLNRYLEDHISLNELVREIERMEKKAGETLRQTVLSRCIDRLAPDEKRGKLLEVIAGFKGRNLDDIRQQLEKLYLDFESKKAEAEEHMAARLNENLREEGIFGSAVIPQVKQSKEWMGRRADLEEAFQEKAEEIRVTVRNL